MVTCPVRFFHESEEQFTRKEIDAMVKKYGKNIVIGGDEGYDEDFRKAMNYTRQVGAFRHVYTMGPGMAEWSQEEKRAMMKLASQYGIDVKSKNWLSQWQSGVWKSHITHQMAQYNLSEYYSIEFDNLDSVLHTDKQLVTFIVELSQYWSRSEMKIRLLLKNLSPEALRILNKQNLPEGFLAPWGMFEQGTGNPRLQIELAKELNVTAITPINGLRPTNNYGTIRDGVARITEKCP